MNYHQRHNRSSFPYIVVTVVVLIGVLIWFRPSVPEWLTSFVYSIGKPVWGVAAVVEGVTDNTRISLYSKRALEAEIERLESELEAVKIQSLTNGILREENQTLRELLGREDIKDYTPAVVLAHGGTLYDTFVIDLGLEDGVRANDIVASPAGIALGRVEAVKAHTARVVLFSAPGEETPVLIGEDELYATAIGRGSGNYLITLPRDIEVVPGDVIVTPELVPQLIAEVQHIESNQTDSFQTILFRNPVTLSKLRYVLVRHHAE